MKDRWHVKLRFILRYPSIYRTGSNKYKCFLNIISATLCCVIIPAGCGTDCYHLKVLQFLQHLRVVLISGCICCSRPTHTHTHTNTLMKSRDWIPDLPHNAFVKSRTLICVWWIFFRCFLQAISDQNKCTCTFFFFFFSPPCNCNSPRTGKNWLPGFLHQAITCHLFPSWLFQLVLFLRLFV